MGVYMLTAFLLGALVGGGGMYLGRRLAEQAASPGPATRRKRAPRCFVVDPTELPARPRPRRSQTAQTGPAFEVEA